MLLHYHSSVGLSIHYSGSVECMKKRSTLIAALAAVRAERAETPAPAGKLQHFCSGGGIREQTLGTGTASTAKKFQSACGLSVDTIVGKNTATKLFG